MTKEELEKEVLKTRDFQEIQNLQAQYGYYVSRGPWADWEGEVCGLFTDDAVIELAYRGVYVGKVGVKKVFGQNGLLCSARRPNYMHILMQLMPYIKVYENDTASGAWQMFGICAGSSSHAEDPIPYLQSGRYEMEYRKVDGKWKISKLAYRQAFASPLDEGWVKTPVIPAPISEVSRLIKQDKPLAEYRPYNPKATCQKEQLVEPALPPDKK